MPAAKHPQVICVMHTALGKGPIVVNFPGIGSTLIFAMSNAKL
jgi:hypothetical protein